MSVGLFDAFTLRGVTLRNRIGLSPMCQYSSQEGRATDWHLVHLGARAVGGAGLLMAEATAVEPRGRITQGCAGLWCDAQVEPLRRINAFIQAQGAVPGVQLAHAGRKGSARRPWEGGGALGQAEGGWETLAPSAIAFGGALDRVPRAMSEQDIAEVLAAYAAATRRALVAGYRWLEVHAAHGYLLHSFCSPLSNLREDGWGGDFDGRVRLVTEVVRTVRALWPSELPLAVRLSCSDWVEGGWDIAQSVALARRLREEGVDLVDCSSGGISAQALGLPGPGWQVPLAERIRREAGVATAAVGEITEPAQAEAIVREGRADLVLLGRAMLREPFWPLRAARALGREADFTPPQYARGWLIDPGSQSAATGTGQRRSER